MQLSKRINFILNELNINNNTTVYDIGCDHGIIGVEMMKKNTTLKVVFCDISQINLNKAKELCLKSNLKNDNYEFWNCDGVPNSGCSNDVGLIFGLGGITIIHILENNKFLNEFYLQTTTSVYELRLYLNKNNYEVLKDYLFYDDKKYYNFIHIKKNDKNCNMSEIELFFGKSNITRKDTLYRNYLRQELKNLSKVLANYDKNMLQYNIDNTKLINYKKKYDLIGKQLKGDFNV